MPRQAGLPIEGEGTEAANKRPLSGVGDVVVFEPILVGRPEGAHGAAEHPGRRSTVGNREIHRKVVHIERSLSFFAQIACNGVQGHGTVFLRLCQHLARLEGVIEATRFLRSRGV